MADTTSQEFALQAQGTQVPASIETDVLPRWDLSHFGYDEPEAGEDGIVQTFGPKFEAEMTALTDLIAGFVGDYTEEIDVGGEKEREATVSRLDADGLGEAMRRRAEIKELVWKVYTYAYLRRTPDQVKFAKAQADVESKVDSLSSKTAFFGDALKKIGEDKIREMLASSEELRYYAPAIEDIRRGIPHTPPLAVEKYRMEQGARGGWVRRYDRITTEQRFPFEGKDLTQGEILKILTDDPDQARREAAYRVFSDGMKKILPDTMEIHNESMHLFAVDAKTEGFDHPWDARHFSNNLKPAVADALEKAVRDSYGSIAERFYNLKARLMGQEYLDPWDRNFNPCTADSRYIPFEEAKQIVLKAYADFSPQMADIAGRFFDEQWIDAAPAPNKESGAYSHPGAAMPVHPYVMMNYRGKPRDVATLAHELGHGVHQVLGCESDALVETPLTFAETASVFGEMLTFKSQLKKAADAGDDDLRRELLMGKVGDMINTAHRQIAFYDFEKRIHTHFQEKGRLSEKDIGGHWRASQQESYGESIRLDDSYNAVFGYISHFVHSPFYVYAYAFGDCLVNALYEVHENGDVPDFREKYIEMLEAGGTITAADLKEKFGLDFEDPEFWKKGLNVIAGFLDKLETLCQPSLEAKQKPAAPAPGLG